MSIPSACTLPVEERPLRLAELESVVGERWISSEWLDDRTALLWLAGDGAAADSVRDLARREATCCSFFTFDVADARDGRIALRVGVSRRHRRVLQAMLANAERVSR